MKKKNLKKFNKKDLISIFIFIILLIVLIIISIYIISLNIGSSVSGKVVSMGRDSSVFHFYLNGSGNFVNGEIYLDDRFYGRTTEGDIYLYQMNNIPKTLRFKGIYDNKRFDLTYNFPRDYFDYNLIPFIVFEEDLTEDKYYYLDKFHWGHMPISYKFKNYCANEKKILSAFSEIQSATNGSVYFVEGDEDIDLNVVCISSQSEKTNYNQEVLSEGGIDSLKDNLILNATIYFYPTISSCGYFPFVEIHEILHTFGYSHIDRISSIMYPNTDNCAWAYEYKDINGNPRIDEDIVNELKEIYG